MRISTAESEIMKVLWAKSPMTAEEIAVALADDQDWAEGTVKALLNRLLKKNAIAAEKDGRRFLYRPMVAQGDYVHAESKGLLDRLFDGRLAPLVSHFSQRERLSDEDVAELRRILKAHDDGR
ncbi:BlaI/MecI/CopY family transcriptional regulator [Caulobacter sp.]|uniref:BlaI/MecI/CopY family transcriptional regulator n=1 Tax=Caulobacter sp. TaxID=78 RepID=UPI003BAE380F